MISPLWTPTFLDLQRKCSAKTTKQRFTSKAMNSATRPSNYSKRKPRNWLNWKRNSPAVLVYRSSLRGTTTLSSCPKGSSRTDSPLRRRFPLYRARSRTWETDGRDKTRLCTGTPLTGRTERGTFPTRSNATPPNEQPLPYLTTSQIQRFSWKICSSVEGGSSTALSPRTTDPCFVAPSKPFSRQSAGWRLKAVWNKAMILMAPI